MPRKKTGGYKPKDSSLRDGFNRKPQNVRPRDPVTGRLISLTGSSELTPEQLKRKARTAREKAARRAARGLPPEEPEGQAPVPTAPPREELLESDLSASFQMLKDMRYVYQQAQVDGKKGRSRLLKLMESDKEFMTLVKELMKLEAALLAARLRKEGDDALRGAGTGFFVVLKGLETEKHVTRGDGSIDLNRLAHVLDPAAGKYEAPIEMEKARLPQTPTEG